jgi:hypothetical protein
VDGRSKMMYMWKAEGQTNIGRGMVGTAYVRPSWRSEDMGKEHPPQ